MSNHFSSYKNLFKIASKGRVLLLSVSLPVVLSASGPTGGTTFFGSAAISYGGVITRINQNTNGAAIEWENFSVDNGSSVEFTLPSANAYTINIVKDGGGESRIHGSVSSNGHFILANPNGIVVGPSGKIIAPMVGLSGYGISDMPASPDATYSRGSIFTAEFGDIIDKDGKNYRWPNKSHVINMGVIEGTTQDVNIFGARIENKGATAHIKAKKFIYTNNRPFGAIGEDYGGFTRNFSRDIGGQKYYNRNRIYKTATTSDSNFTAASVLIASHHGVLFNEGKPVPTPPIGVVDHSAHEGGDVHKYKIIQAQIGGNFNVDARAGSYPFREYSVTPEPTSGVNIYLSSGNVDDVTVNFQSNTPHNSLTISGMNEGYDSRAEPVIAPTAIDVGSNIALNGPGEKKLIVSNFKDVFINGGTENFLDFMENNLSSLSEAPEFIGRSRFISYARSMRVNKNLFSNPNLFAGSGSIKIWPREGSIFIADSFDVVHDLEFKEALHHSSSGSDSEVRLFLTKDSVVNVHKKLYTSQLAIPFGESRIRLEPTASLFFISGRDKREATVVRTPEQWKSLPPSTKLVAIADNIDFGGELLEAKSFASNRMWGNYFYLFGLGNKMHNFKVGGDGLIKEITGDKVYILVGLNLDGELFVKNPGNGGVGLISKNAGEVMITGLNLKAKINVEVDDDTDKRVENIGGAFGKFVWGSYGAKILGEHTINTEIVVTNKTNGNYKNIAEREKLLEALEVLDSSSDVVEVQSAAEKVSRISDGVTLKEPVRISNIGGFAGTFGGATVDNRVSGNSFNVTTNIKVLTHGVDLVEKLKIRETLLSVKERMGKGELGYLPTNTANKIDKLYSALDMGANGSNIGGLGGFTFGHAYTTPLKYGKAILKGELYGETNVGGLFGLSSAYIVAPDPFRIKSEQKIVGYEKNVGGLFGKADHARPLLPDFYFVGKIHSTNASNVGGFIGYMSGVEGWHGHFEEKDFASTFISGEIIGRDHVGGLFGVAGSSSLTKKGDANYINAKVFATKHTARTGGYSSSGIGVTIFDGLIGSNSPDTVKADTHFNGDKNRGVNVTSDSIWKTEVDLSKKRQVAGSWFPFVVTSEPMGKKPTPIMGTDSYLGVVPVRIEVQPIATPHTPTPAENICVSDPSLCKPRLEAIDIEFGVVPPPASGTVPPSTGGSTPPSSGSGTPPTGGGTTDNTPPPSSGTVTPQPVPPNTTPFRPSRPNPPSRKPEPPVVAPKPIPPVVSPNDSVGVTESLVNTTELTRTIASIQPVPPVKLDIEVIRGTINDSKRVLLGLKDNESAKLLEKLLILEAELVVLTSNPYVPSQITAERLKRLKDEVERIKSITLSKSSKGKERIVGAHQSVMDEVPIRIR